jgi:hypothetical protein
VSSLSEGFRELSVSKGDPSAMADLVIGAAMRHNLPVYECMERAVAQYQAVGGDHLALRRTFIERIADSAARTPQIEEEHSEEEDSDRTETDESEEEEGGEPEGGEPWAA